MPSRLVILRPAREPDVFSRLVAASLKVLKESFGQGVHDLLPAAVGLEVLLSNVGRGSFAMNQDVIPGLAALGCRRVAAVPGLRGFAAAIAGGNHSTVAVAYVLYQLAHLKLKVGYNSRTPSSGLGVL